MARRIQRAWRSYRTHKLVNRYANIIVPNTPSKGSLLDELPSEKEKLSSDSQEIVIESEELYPKELDQRKITYISNLDPDDEN